MSFSISYDERVIKKDIQELDTSIRAVIKQAIEKKLTQMPHVYGKPLRYSLKHMWSLRVGDYRIIYTIEGTNVIVLRIGHRREVYEI